ncbi:MAG TPA: 2OG-Fe(II) oxygenase family protein [Actinomycetota bacterium]|nr:2OG-Fe(II) oxygenase family protein [Actinomycetota bacterium]
MGLTDLGALEAWIAPQHLGSTAVAGYRDAFQAHPARMTVIHDFLREEVADRLSKFLLREAEYRVEYGIYSVEGSVPEEQYLEADGSDRFFQMHRLAGIPQEHRMSMNALTYLKLRETFQQPAFESFFQDLTGMALGASDDFGVHSMRVGDYLRPHSDDNKDRALALVMYLTPGWEPTFGGSLHMVDGDGNETRVDADYNSIVLFDVLAGTSHSVSPVEPSAGDAARVTIGGWYHRADRS